jgi:hypothetical protein
VLISILLALVEVNTKESLNSMRPYARLRDLGRDGRDGGYAQYNWAGSELEAWIINAKTNAGAPPVPTTTGLNGEEWELRRNEIEDRFASFERAYTKLFKEVDTRTDVFDVTIVYELRRDILEALGDLQRAVRHVTPKSVDDEDY